MRRKRMLRFVFLMPMVFFLLSSQPALSLEHTIDILGDVVGKGNAEMKTAFDRWISISDKAFPLINGAHLRSGNGMMSSIFRDGARMEVGGNSQIVVTGAKGSYSVEMSRGKIAFSAPQGISFSVATPTSAVQTHVRPNMIQTVSTTSQDYVRGTVGYDGKGTTITTVSGTLLVKDAKGAAAHTVTAGNSIYISGTESGRRAELAQVREFLPPVGTAPPLPSAVIGSEPVVPWPLLGGLVLLEGGSYLYVNSQVKVQKSGSPSSP